MNKVINSLVLLLLFTKGVYVFGGDDEVNAIARRPNGRIIVVGMAEIDDDDSEYLAVAQFLPSGQLDGSGSFGADTRHTRTIIPGTFYIPVPLAPGATGFEPCNVAITPNGKILVAGETDSYLLVAQFNDNGRLDESFGRDSQYSMIPGTVYIPSLNGTENNNDLSGAMSLDKDGNIIVVGTTRIEDEGRRLAAVRLLPNGLLDDSFGSTNEHTISLIPGTMYLRNSIMGNENMHDQPNTMAINKDGEIIIGGGIYSYNGDEQAKAFIAKLTPNGQLDTTFGSPQNGISSLIPGTEFFADPFSPQATGSWISSLKVRLNGTIVFAGTSSTLDYANKKIFVGQMFSNGQLDDAFGAGSADSLLPGTIFIPHVYQEESSDELKWMGLKNNGSIILCGETRYNSNNVLYNEPNDEPNDEHVLETDEAWLESDNEDRESDWETMESGEDSCDSEAEANELYQAEADESNEGGHFHPCCIQLLENGMFDPAFGGTDEYTTSIFPGIMVITSPELDRSFRFIEGVVKPDDGIIIASEFVDDDFDTHFALIQLLSNGRLHEEFGIDSGSSLIPGTVYIEGFIRPHEPSEGSSSESEDSASDED